MTFANGLICGRSRRLSLPGVKDRCASGCGVASLSGVETSAALLSSWESSPVFCQNLDFCLDSSLELAAGRMSGEGQLGRSGLVFCWPLLGSRKDAVVLLCLRVLLMLDCDAKTDLTR